MAMDPNREALRIYSDPSIPHGEKIRLLEELNAPPALPPMGSEPVAGPGGGADAGWGNTNPEILAGNQAIEADAEQQRLQAEAAQREQSKPAEPEGNWLFGREQPQQPATPAAEPEPQVEPAEDAAPAVSPGDYRNALSRAALSIQRPAGAPAKPQERITEESQVQVGPLGQGDLDEYQRLQQESVDAQVEADRLEAQQEKAARAVQTQALAQEMSERKRLETIRNQVMSEMSRVRAQQDAISQEIASAEPAEEGLFVGKNFGESLLTVISLLAFGLGSGATGTADQIVPYMQQLARREVDRQKRWSELREGQMNALGTAYERHLANLRDHELASAATQADILKMAELQTLKLSQDPTNDERTAAQLQAKAAALNAAAMAEYAKLASLYGDRIQRGTQLAYQQERGAFEQRRAAAEAAATQAPQQPGAEAYDDPEAYFTSLAGQEPELDADVRDTTGARQRSNETTTLSPSEEEQFQAWARANKIKDANDPAANYDYRGFWRESGGAKVRFGVDHFPDKFKQHGHETFSVESQYSSGAGDGGRWEGEKFVPAAGAKAASESAKPAGKARGAAGSAQAAAAPTGGADETAVSRALALHQQGRTDQAVATLPAPHREFLRKLFVQAKSDLGAGGTDADAMDIAMQRAFDVQSPASLVPQSARDRVVRNAGKTYFAGDKTAAALAQKQLTDADKAIGLSSQMARLAEQYKGSGYKSPELRGKLLAIGSDLMAILSKVDEQGVIREGGDEARYSSRAGLAVRDYLQDPTTDHAAAVKETLRTLQAGKRRVLDTLTTSWTGDEPARRQIREVR